MFTESVSIHQTCPGSSTGSLRSWLHVTLMEKCLHLWVPQPTAHLPFPRDVFAGTTVPRSLHRGPGAADYFSNLICPVVIVWEVPKPRITPKKKVIFVGISENSFIFPDFHFRNLWVFLSIIISIFKSIFEQIKWWVFKYGPKTQKLHGSLDLVNQENPSQKPWT